MGKARIIGENTSQPAILPGEGLLADSKAANEANIGRQLENRLARGKGLQTLAFYLLVLLGITFGWKNRGGVYITPEEGAGYVLGITGGSMMLLLLMYPVRKHMRWARGLGRVSHWFRIHMLLGVIGPVCILYHCNFQLGSANGNIALFSMLLVAGSGLVGRYFYTRIHHGLYGRKADLSNLGRDAAAAKSIMSRVLEAAPGLRDRLQRLEQQAVAPSPGFLSGMFRVVVIEARIHWLWLASGPALRRAVMNPAQGVHLSPEERLKIRRRARHQLRSYLETIRRVAGLAFYERLFSLWHILHLPLFVMLVISGFVHVYAVHMY